MKRMMILLTFAALLLTLCVPVMAEEAIDWDALEDSYYTGTSPFTGRQATLEKANNTEEERIDYSVAVERFRMKYALLSPSAIGHKERFVSEFSAGKTLLELSETTRWYYTPYYDREGEGTGLVSEDGAFLQAFLGDGGKTYKLNLTDTLKEQLKSSSLVFSELRAYNLYLPDLCTGVLFSDGASELNWFQSQGQFSDSRFNAKSYLFAKKAQTQHGRRICADRAVFIGGVFLILANLPQ